MSVLSKSGALALNTVTGHQTVEVGFQPKLVVFQSTPDTANIVTSIANGHFTMGAFDGTTQAVQASNTRNGTSTSDTQKYADITNVIYVADPPGTMTPDFIASAYSLNPTGFTIDITNAPPIDYRFGYWALGGDDITNVKVGSFISKGSTGSQAITGLGFQPDIIICWTSGSWGGLPADQGDAVVGIGFANGIATDNQYAMGSWSQSGITDVLATQSTNNRGYVIWCPLQKTFVSLQATLTSFDVSGFTLNWVAHSPVSQHNISYIAIKGTANLYSRVGRILISGVTGNTASVTGFGFTPGCGLFASASFPTVTGTMAAGERSSMGWVDFEKNMFQTARASRFNAGYLSAWHTSHDLRTYRYINYSTSQLIDEATLQTWDTDGFTFLSNKGNGAGGNLVGYLVMNADSITPTPPTPQPELEENTGIYV